MIKLPDGLHPSTVELVEGFTTALAEKLRSSEIKYGWSDGWKDADWRGKCLADFNHHIDKGDPRDVAAYCAFMWFHGWQTKRLNATAQPVSEGCKWSFDDDGYWESACGGSWVFNDGGPIENECNFCQKCGGKVVLPAAPGGQDD